MSGQPRNLLKQRGISMLEVLVSLVVLSIGALGAAGMQVSSLKDSGSAASRFRAVSLAQGMIDAMRADRTLSVAGGVEYETVLAAGSCTGTDTVTVLRWLNQVACDLPDGKGRVVVNPLTKRAIVTVQWNDARGRDGDASQLFSLETRL